ncbi:MAG: hypothetical protein JWN50_592 [Parcubacteria group bacterium]|nr:hypothetical protein [Parcubacteria group bacterium]
MAATVAIFLIWKLTSLHFRFGDENVYFYMTHAIQHGLLPYKDFFLADPPFFIFLLTGFKALIGTHYLLFKTLPPLFDAASAVLIYLILIRNSTRFAWLGPAFYLFSFSVLSTSDYMTGAEVMIFFILLANLLDQHGKSFWSGVSWALACLCKLYAAPALIGFLIYKLLKRERHALRNIILGGILAALIVLLPFFIMAPHQTLYDLILHQFHRPAGINKWNVWQLFLGFEWLLILAACVGAYYTKHRTLVFELALSAIFLLWYKDLYYLYLHLLMPYLALLAAEFVSSLSVKKSELAWGFIGLYVVILMYPLLTYTSTFAPQGIFENPQEIADALRLAPKSLPAYGAQEVAPLVALMADRPIFENIIDTNTQNFAAGTHNLKNISADIQKSGAYLISRIADYPDQGVTDIGYESYFDPNVFTSSCTKFKAFTRPNPADLLNDVTIYTCL